MNIKELQVEMTRKDITLKHLAGAIGITLSGLYNKINGKTDFTLPEVQAMVKLFNLSDERMKDIFFN